MKNIIKISSILSVSTVVLLITGLIKNKFLAISLGPSGIGVVSQLYNYLNISTTISSFGLTQGVTKYVAETYNFPDRYKHLKIILMSATVVVLFVSLTICLFTVIFSKSFSVILLGNNTNYNFLIIVAMAIPMHAMNQIYISFVQGLKEIKRFTAASMLTSIIGLCSLFPMVLFFHITGAIINILIIAIINCGIFFYVSKNLVEKKDTMVPYKVNILEFTYFKNMIKFGYFRLIQTSIYPLTMLIVRSFIIKHLGVSNNGIYETICTFSLLYVPIIHNILWSYSYPNFCNAKNNDILSVEVNQFLKLSLFIAIPMIICINLFSKPLIQVLFSAEFLPAVKVVNIALIGDFLKVLIWPFNVVLIAKNRMKIAIIFELIWNILFLVLTFFTISIHSLKGIFMIQNISLLVLLLLSCFYVNKEFSLKISKNNLKAALVSLLIILIIGNINFLSDFLK